MHGNVVQGCQFSGDTKASRDLLGDWNQIVINECTLFGQLMEAMVAFWPNYSPPISSFTLFDSVMKLSTAPNRRHSPSPALSPHPLIRIHPELLQLAVQGRSLHADELRGA